MKNFNETHSNAGQSTTNVKKPQKHDANLQKNSALYFQVGLILCLLGTYLLFEMNFATHVPKIDQALVAIDDETEIIVPEFKIYEEQAPKEEVKQKQRRIVDKEPTIVEDDFNEKQVTETIITEPVATSTPVDPGDIVIDKVVEDIPVPFFRIEKAPIYPGCEDETTNEARKKCMSEKITRLVNKKFSTSIASELGLSGVQKIYVEFKVDKSGKVSDIKTRAPHKGLEKEAERVVKKIPEMTPGMQRENPVEVIYTFPIIFQVMDY
ncbi:energy transducer TonB [Gaetbulibacter jejuensis]|uniref:energy transducer TonB n=1 Tax=Gaetbulibacter jejuensis TaxID=584607 RepID=UPI00300B6B57